MKTMLSIDKNGRQIKLLRGENGKFYKVEDSKNTEHNNVYYLKGHNALDVYKELQNEELENNSVEVKKG